MFLWGKSEKSSNKKEISEAKTETVSDEITPEETVPEEDTVAEEEYIFPYSNSQYFPGGCDIELYYAVIDLANDGVPELFISDRQTIYKVEPHETYADCAEAICHDGDTYFWGTMEYDGFTKTGIATAQDYNAMLDRSSIRDDINWYKLSEFE